jgi:DNA-binding CsgD family transcriptional regulator
MSLSYVNKEGIRVELTDPDLLTPKVAESALHLASGETLQEAADELDRDIETVKTYAKTFRETMHAKSMLAAVAKAVAMGLISISEVNAKTLFACAMITASGFSDDQDDIRRTPVRNTPVRRTSTRLPRTPKREESMALFFYGDEVVLAKREKPELCFRVPGALDSAFAYGLQDGRQGKH